MNASVSHGPLNLDEVRIDPIQALRLPAPIALRRRLLPFTLCDGEVWVACHHEESAESLQTLQRYFERPLHAITAEPESLRRALGRIYRDGDSRIKKSGDEEEDEEGAAVALGNEILRAAMLRRASDVHLDPSAEGLRVRFRVDGALEEAYQLPATAQAALTNRFKILSGLNIAERRAPQDGSFRHRDLGEQVDIRVATIPNKYGERLTLRLLAVDTRRFDLTMLGMSPRHDALFREAISKPHGLILLTGPTGSGKTTTLYAAIRDLLRQEALNVITIEDPVENEIPGIVQVEVDSADKVNFGSALRSVLRHDPDVVMIGEMRDRETADIAIKAALTGHLVFSTLHTNSAAGAVVRLADMGLERFLVASTLRLVVAQRLVRELCPRCHTPRSLTEMEATFLGDPALAGSTIWEPRGCIYCGGKGYVGRLGLFEMLPVNEAWSKLIAAGADEATLVAEMRSSSLFSLLNDATEKLLAGRVSLSDVRAAVTVW